MAQIEPMEAPAAPAGSIAAHAWRAKHVTGDTVGLQRITPAHATDCQLKIICRHNTLFSVVAPAASTLRRVRPKTSSQTGAASGAGEDASISHSKLHKYLCFLEWRGWWIYAVAVLSASPVRECAVWQVTLALLGLQACDCAQISS